MAVTDFAVPIGWAEQIDYRTEMNVSFHAGPTVPDTLRYLSTVNSDPDDRPRDWGARKAVNLAFRVYPARLKRALVEAALYRNKTKLVMFAANQENPRRFRKIAKVLGMRPETRGGMTVFVSEVSEAQLNDSPAQSTHGVVR